MTAVDDAITVPGWSPSEAVIAAEQSVIGSVIQSRAAAETASGIVRAQDFYVPRHQLVFEATTALIEDGQDVDPRAVLKELTRRGTLTKVGAGPGLIDLMAYAGIGSLRRDAATVRDDAIRRAISELGPFIGQVTGSGDFELEHHVDMIRKRFEDAIAPIIGTDEPRMVGDLLLEVLEDLERPLTAEDMLPPPYQDLERILPGARPGQLIVIGARPSIGKSLVSLDLARAAAVRLRMPTLMFSMEMTHDEIMYRLLAAEATVNLERFNKHELTGDDWSRISKVQERIFAAPLAIDDASKCTVARIRARIRGMARKDPARLIIVDYLGLMETGRAETRERAIADITRDLKNAAKELKVPIVLLSQLNRQSEHRPDKKPAISDLRESGAIEQDADVIILLHREDFYDKESPRAGELDLLVLKNRNGPTGTVTVAFQGQYGRAADMYREG